MGFHPLCITPFAHRARKFQFLATLAMATILGANASATIAYHVSLIKRNIGGALHVQMIIPSGTGREVLKSPVWQPGAYAEYDFGKAVENFQVKNGDGTDANFQHPDFSTWVTEGNRGNLVIRYDVPIGIADNTVHFGGEATYLYVDGRKTEKCSLTIEAPAGWKIANGLDPVSSRPNEFQAPTYDVMADTPTTIGNFLSDTYTSHGKPHEIVLYGGGARFVDHKALIKACKFVSDAEGNFFGETPYKRYVWHFSVYQGSGGGGGLEHLNGTEITLPSTLTGGTEGLLMHEFFHLWNVKRIRAKVLGPFDYTQLPRTGALWWLEGVTDYYAYTLETRYGWTTPAHLYETVAQNISRTNANADRMNISPYDSSFRVRDADNGHGNSNGYLVSYYNTGWVLGMMLDTDIRLYSHGKYSLDSVEMALWQLCKNNQPGFQEDEIRNLCKTFGGDQTATDFDNWVMKPGDLPVDIALKRLGLIGKSVTVEKPWLPFETAQKVVDGQMQFFVSDPGSTSLQIGDRLTTVNGVEASQFMRQNLRTLLRDGKIGAQLSVVVDRDGNSQTISTALVAHEVPTYVVSEDPNATAAQKQMRKAWLSPRPGTKTVYLKPLFP